MLCLESQNERMICRTKGIHRLCLEILFRLAWSLGGRSKRHETITHLKEVLREHLGFMLILVQCLGGQNWWETVISRGERSAFASST